MQNPFRRFFSGSNNDREFEPQNVRQVPSTVVKMITHDSNEDLVPSGMYTHIPDPDFTRVTIGPYGYTRCIEEDIQVLSANGFNITTDIVGSGAVSNVMFGYFGVEARGLVDTNGQLLRNVTVGTPFAVKLINFDLNNRSYDAIRDREAFANEKYILTKVSHPNIVQIFMAINMGPSRLEPFRRNPGYSYQIFERVYIIMEFANTGCLEDYITDHRLSEEYCVKFIKEIFYGLRFLHNNHILHGDLHMGNILVFNEGTDDSPVLTVKLADFGFSRVSDGVYHSAPELSPTLWERDVVFDITALNACVRRIQKASACSQGWKRIIKNLRSVLKTVKDLNDIRITKKFEFLLNRI